MCSLRFALCSCECLPPSSGVSKFVLLTRALHQGIHYLHPFPLFLLRLSLARTHTHLHDIHKKCRFHESTNVQVHPSARYDSEKGETTRLITDCSLDAKEIFDKAEKTKSKLNDEKITEETKSVQSLKPGHGGFKHYTSRSERPKFRSRPAEVGENFKITCKYHIFHSTTAVSLR